MNQNCKSLEFQLGLQEPEFLDSDLLIIIAKVLFFNRRGGAGLQESGVSMRVTIDLFQVGLQESCPSPRVLIVRYFHKGRRPNQDF